MYWRGECHHRYGITRGPDFVLAVWNSINSAANYLSDDFIAQDFDFYGRTMSGKKEMQPRWKRAVSTVDGSLGEAVGQMYVEKYFPAAAKERMVAPAVKNLQESLGERIKGPSWTDKRPKKKHLKTGDFPCQDRVSG